MNCKKSHLQLIVILFLELLLPFQVAGSLNAVLGQGMKQSALRHLEKMASSNVGEIQMDASGGIVPHMGQEKLNAVHLDIDGKRHNLRHSKEGEWIAEEYNLVVDEKQYIFKEYIPEIFGHLRALFKIKNNKFYESWNASSLEEFQNPADSGSSFVTSVNSHYMLKSVMEQYQETKTFQDGFPQYVHYVISNPNSFITRYIGYYSVQEIGSDKVEWFVCMPNLLAYPAAILSGAEPASIDYRFDLKGHKYQRNVKWREWKKSQPTLLDWEFNLAGNDEAFFKNGIILDENVYKQIADTISQDTAFLANEMNVFDYSLLIGIHFNTDAEQLKDQENQSGDIESAEDFPRMSNGGIPASCVGCRMPTGKAPTPFAAGPEEYGSEPQSISLHIGIIDVLSKFILRRAIRRVLRVDVRKECEPKDQTHIPPNQYAARFKCSMNRDVFRVKDEKAMSSFGVEYCADYNKIDWSDKKKEKGKFTRFATRLATAGKRLLRKLKGRTRQGVKKEGRQ